MKITFNKYTEKQNFVISIIPTIMFGKDDGIWNIVAVWLCFSIDISF